MTILAKRIAKVIEDSLEGAFYNVRQNHEGPYPADFQTAARDILCMMAEVELSESLLAAVYAECGYDGDYTVKKFRAVLNAAIAETVG